MARKLDPKAIKQRIKENREVMRDSKKIVTAHMKLGTNLEPSFDTKAVRNALSDFCKAAIAVATDTEKLASIDA